MNDTIAVENLSYRYPGAERPAIDSLTFSIAQGEIFGLLGPSGAGKSTAIKTMLGVLRGYRGSIRIDRRELTSWGRELFARIGVAFEFPGFYPRLTALENLRFFASLYPRSGERPEALLERFGLLDAANKRYEEFSKGMRMRLNYCRAIMHRPEILVLDEPTSGLDPGLAAEVKRSIREQSKRDVTVVLTTHDMHVADELSDRVAFIADGGIRALDAPRDLKARFGRRSVLVEYREAGALLRREFSLAALAGDPELAELVQSGAVETIHSQETTLERVFLAVTGTELIA